MNRPALFDEYNTPSCGELLVEELSPEDQEFLDKVFGGRKPAPPITCERRAGHPGSHYGVASNRSAAWDEEMVYSVGADLGWASFEPRGDYHKMPTETP
jgi:hypothetical protein